LMMASRMFAAIWLDRSEAVSGVEFICLTFMVWKNFNCLTLILQDVSRRAPPLARSLNPWNRGASPSGSPEFTGKMKRALNSGPRQEE
jgi:hypothetical protein